MEKRREELKKLFTDEFMKAHTKFETFEDFLKDYELLNPVADIDRKLEAEDEKIKKHTKFSSWKEMLEKAANEEIKLANTAIFTD